MARPMLAWLPALLCAGPAVALGAEACVAPGYAQFDFWLGDWNVFRPDGTQVGSNRITSEYGGCVVHEHYTTGKGYSGESLNIYDAARGLWHQTWVDSEGMLLVLEGQWHEGRMLLLGARPDADGVMHRQRISWTPNQDGTVRQLWESSTDGQSWRVVFDGLYRHIAAGAAAPEPPR